MASTAENIQAVEVKGKNDSGKVVPADAVSQIKIDLLKKEIELLKREKILLQREKNLEDNAAFSQSSNSSCLSDTRTNNIRMGIHEVKTLINEFNPTTSTISAKNWLDSIEGLKRVYDWDDKNTLFYATLRLGGAASFWYQSKQDSLNTFDGFKKELLESFPSSESETSVLMKIMERKRLPYEPIEDYVYQVAALAKQIRLDETSIIKYIISGLSDQNLINVLMATNCESIPHLLIMVKKFEEVQKQGQTRKNLFEYKNEPSTSRNSRHDLPYKHYQLDKNKNKFKQCENIKKRFNNREHFDREKKIKIDNVLCFKCNEPGHISKHCRTKNYEKKCFRCLQPGHYAKDCKIKLVSNLSKTKNVQVIRDEYHKIIHVDGKEFVAFFDLGSDCSTIQYSKVRENNWDIEESDVELVIRWKTNKCVRKNK